MDTLIAKNQKNAKAFNAAILWLMKHNEANNARDYASDHLEDGQDEQDSKAWRKANRRCEQTYDKFLEYMEELPKYEQDRIYKSDLF